MLPLQARPTRAAQGVVLRTGRAVPPGRGLWGHPLPPTCLTAPGVSEFCFMKKFRVARPLSKQKSGFVLQRVELVFCTRDSVKSFSSGSWEGGQAALIPPHSVCAGPQMWINPGPRPQPPDGCLTAITQNSQVLCGCISRSVSTPGVDLPTTPGFSVAHTPAAAAPLCGTMRVKVLGKRKESSA